MPGSTPVPRLWQLTPKAVYNLEARLVCVMLGKLTLLLALSFAGYFAVKVM